MIMNDRILGLLGLCDKAGTLSFGANLACEAVSRGAPLAIVSSDVSSNTEKRIRDKCSFYGSRFKKVSYTSSAIGHAIGKESAIAAVAVTDGGLSGRLIELIDLSEGSGDNNL